MTGSSSHEVNFVRVWTVAPPETREMWYLPSCSMQRQGLTAVANGFLGAHRQVRGAEGWAMSTAEGGDSIAADRSGVFRNRDSHVPGP